MKHQHDAAGFDTGADYDPSARATNAVRIDSLEAELRLEHPKLAAEGIFDSFDPGDDFSSVLARLKRHERVSLQAVLFAAKSPEITGRMFHLWCLLVARERALGGARMTTREMAEALCCSKRTVRTTRKHLVDIGWAERGDKRSVWHPKLPPHLEDVPMGERKGLPDWFLRGVTDPHLIDPPGDTSLVGSGFQRFCTWMLFRAHSHDGEAAVWVGEEKMARSLSVDESYFRRLRKYLDRDGCKEHTGNTGLNTG